MADLVPAELLAVTAADMRAVADAAAGSWGSGGSSWRPDDPLDSYEVHVTAWDPDMAREIAGWLDSKAARYADPDRHAALVEEMAAGVVPPMIRVAEAWWRSRGREPGREGPAT